MINNYARALKNRVERIFEQYDRVALYGTGKKLIEVMQYVPDSSKVCAIIDRDDSDKIGSYINDIPVMKLKEIEENVDVILISNSKYQTEIYDRIQGAISKENKLDVLKLYDFGDEPIYSNSVEEQKNYLEYIEKMLLRKQDGFIDISSEKYELDSKDVRVLAWYLPQYYEIPSNNEIYGRGFTEWSNTSRTIPVYVGHNQPRIPYDVGYYCLNSPEVMQRQVELAKMYGIYGFCFHYYWFSGERTMEKPLFLFRQNENIDFHYCINWATEDWTASWNGGDKRVIYKQKIEPGDDVRFWNDIKPFFEDRRYIRVDNKPLLIIYSVRFERESAINSFLSSLQKLAQKDGFEGLYILITNRYGEPEQVEYYGADGVVVYGADDQFFANCPTKDVDGYINPYFSGNVYDYKEYVEKKMYQRTFNNTNVFYGALTGFDNSARYSEKASIYDGSTPDLYKKWLKYAIEKNSECHKPEDNYVFVGSWNEWAEASYLEPDYRFGYGYLQKTKEAIRESRIDD